MEPYISYVCTMTAMLTRDKEEEEEEGVKKRERRRGEFWGSRKRIKRMLRKKGCRACCPYATAVVTCRS